jgi:hypothetical protein
MLKQTGAYVWSYNQRTARALSDSGEMPEISKERIETFINGFKSLSGIELKSHEFEFDSKNTPQEAWFNFDYNKNNMNLGIINGCPPEIYEGLAKSKLNLGIINGCPPEIYEGLAKSKQMPDDLDKRILFELSVTSPKRGFLKEWFSHFYRFDDYKVRDGELLNMLDNVAQIYKDNRIQ